MKITPEAFIETLEYMLVNYPKTYSLRNDEHRLYLVDHDDAEVLSKDTVGLTSRYNAYGKIARWIKKHNIGSNSYDYKNRY